MKIEKESDGKNMTNKRYVNVIEISAYTSLPVKTLYEWASLGRIPSIKLCRRVLFDLEDIDSFMENLKRLHNQSEKTVNKIIGDLHGNGI